MPRAGFLFVVLLLAALRLATPAQAAEVDYQIHLDAPRAQRDLLRDNLELYRWLDQTPLDSEFVDKLYRETPAEIRKLMATEGYYAADVRTDIARDRDVWRIDIGVSAGARTHVGAVAIEFAVPADLALDRDAEGRLVLGDALTRASEEKPELLIDFFKGEVHPASTFFTLGIKDDEFEKLRAVKAKADIHFVCVDAATGKKLWQFQTGSGIIGQPTTYRGPDGRQYVAILSGVGGWAGAIVAGDLDPRDKTAALGFVGGMTDLKDVTTKGGMLYVFRLR